MSFWSGVVKGMESNQAQRNTEAQREEREAAREEATKWQEKMFDYTSKREALLDERSQTAIDLANSRFESTEARADAALALEQTRHDATTKLTAQNLKEERAFRDRRAEAEDDKSLKAWELDVKKFDVSKGSVAFSEKNADRIFTQSVAEFDAQNKIYTADSLRKDSEEARAIAEGLRIKERDKVGDDAAKANFDRRIKEWDESVAQQREKLDLLQSAEDRAKDDQILKRTEKLLDLMPANMINSLGGGKPRGGSDEKTMTVKAMQVGGTKFSALLAEMGEDEQSSDFFKGAAKSPAAQATIISFMEAQAEKGNTIKLEDMPRYFKYLGTVKGKGEKEAKEFLETIMSGDANLGDLDANVEGLMVLKNLKATEELFIQISAPSSITDKNGQFALWQNAIEVEAQLATDNLPDGQKDIVANALSQMARPETRNKGMGVLAKMGFGLTAATDGNMMENPIIGSFYNSDPTASDSASTVSKLDGGKAVEQSAIDAEIIASKQATSFDSWDAVTAARNEGFTGNADVNGVVRFVNPLEANATPAGLDPDGKAPTIQDSTDKPKTPTSDGFLGSGEVKRPSLPTDTAIDDMFGDVFDSPNKVEENSVMFPERPEQDLGFNTVEEGIPGLESAVKGYAVAPEDASRSAQLRESQAFDLVVSELEDMGVEWPTNREELGYFRDDLVSLTSDYDVELPNDIMVKLVEKAKESSRVGIIPAGDIARIKRAAAAEDKDTLSNLMNKYGVDAVSNHMGLGN